MDTAPRHAEETPLRHTLQAQHRIAFVYLKLENGLY